MLRHPGELPPHPQLEGEGGSSSGTRRRHSRAGGQHEPPRAARKPQSDRTRPSCVCVGVTALTGQWVALQGSGRRIAVRTLDIRAGTPIALKPHVMIPVMPPVVGVCAFPVDEHNDFLLIGTRGSVTLFDVDKKTAVFVRDFADPVCAVWSALLPGSSIPMAFVGTGFSLQAFDVAGNEAFWTLSGGVILSVASLIKPPESTFEKPPQNNLLVASKDSFVRWFENETYVGEILEHSPAAFLVGLSHSSFGFILEDGSVGVYSGSKRLWKKRSDDKAVLIKGVDLNSSEIGPLVAVAQTSGKLTLRSLSEGTILWAAKFDAAISHIFSRPCNPADERPRLDYFAVFATGQVEQLNLRIKSLNSESLAEESWSILKRKHAASETLRLSADPALSLCQPQVRCRFNLDAESAAGYTVTVEVDVENVIESALFEIDAFPELFRVMSPKSSHAQLVVRPPKHVKHKVSITLVLFQAHAQRRFKASTFIDVPAFSTCAARLEGSNEASGSVRIPCNVAHAEFVKWLEAVFPFGRSSIKRLPSAELTVVDVCEGSSLRIMLAANNELLVQTDSIKLAGAVVTNFCERFVFADAYSDFCFRKAENAAFQLWDGLCELKKARDRIRHDIAELSLAVKSLAVLAEDQCQIEDMFEMMDTITKIHALQSDAFTFSAALQRTEEEIQKKAGELEAVVEEFAAVRCGESRVRACAFGREAISTGERDLFASCLKPDVRPQK
ncbi:ciliary BBSome complex subunit 2 [Zopfochytrium polystomum]|nr:ciliary BBSome complex subunit 2 [Zopfochytrium polystomum]